MRKRSQQLDCWVVTEVLLHKVGVLGWEGRYVGALILSIAPYGGTTSQTSLNEI